MVQMLKILVLAAIAGVAALMLYDAIKGPKPAIIGQGKTVSKSRYSDKSAERPTRHVRRGKLTYWQVQSPDGTWLDCSSDCAEAYRRQVLDFWETRREHKATGN